MPPMHCLFGVHHVLPSERDLFSVSITPCCAYPVTNTTPVPVVPEEAAEEENTLGLYMLTRLI